MAETQPHEKAKLTFRNGAEVRTFSVGPHQTVTVGRSSKADYQVEDTAVSLIHAKVALEAHGGRARLAITDTSTNGTAVIPPGMGATAAAPIPRGQTIGAPVGSGLMVPAERPVGLPQRGSTVLWIEVEAQPERKPRRDHSAILPVKDRRPRPSTWPRAWASLPDSVLDIWEREGIEDALDLAGFYTSPENADATLAEEKVPEADRRMAVAYWRDTRKANAVSQPSGTPTERRAEAQQPQRGEAPQLKRRRITPKVHHAPGIAHTRWLEKERAKDTKAVQAQGLNPAKQEHLDEVWEIYLRAGARSTLHRKVEGQDKMILKDLILKPVSRYADSLAGRLATWRRWEAWVFDQPYGLGGSAFRPSDLLMGKYLSQVDKGGPTAASQAWAGLRWWATRLGLDLQLESTLVHDFKLKQQGHTTRQAEVLPLTAVARLREAAEMKGTVGAFASIALLLAGGCIRFIHAQRSELIEVTEDLVIFRCLKGKRRRHGIREGFRWATPRCWRPGGDTLAKAVVLIKDVATKAKNYGEKPFLVPDLATGQGHSISPDDAWLPRPMTYSRFVDLMRTLLKTLGGWGKPEPPTFNALRRLMPTGADVLQFSDTVAAAIGNWQDTPKGDSDRIRGKTRDQMAKRYAGEKTKTAGLYKLQVVAAIWDVRGEENQGGDGWTRMRPEYSDKKALKRLINNFPMEGPMSLGGDEPKCLPR